MKLMSYAKKVPTYNDFIFSIFQHIFLFFPSRLLLEVTAECSCNNPDCGIWQLGAKMPLDYLTLLFV